MFECPEQAVESPDGLVPACEGEHRRRRVHGERDGWVWLILRCRWPLVSRKSIRRMDTPHPHTGDLDGIVSPLHPAGPRRRRGGRYFPLNEPQGYDQGKSPMAIPWPSAHSLTTRSRPRGFGPYGRVEGHGGRCRASRRTRMRHGASMNARQTCLATLLPQVLSLNSNLNPQ